MTLRSLKKRRITVLKSTRATKTEQSSWRQDTEPTALAAGSDESMAKYPRLAPSAHCSGLKRTLIVVATLTAMTINGNEASAQAVWSTPNSSQQSAVKSQRSYTSAKTVAPRTRQKTARRFDASFSTDNRATATSASSRGTALRWRSSDRVDAQPFEQARPANVLPTKGPVMRVVYQSENASEGTFSNPFGAATDGPATTPPPSTSPSEIDLFGNPFGDSPTPPTTIQPSRPEPLSVPELKDSPTIPSSPEDLPSPSDASSQPELPESGPLTPPRSEDRGDLDSSRIDPFDNPFKRKREEEAADSMSDRTRGDDLPEPTPRTKFGLQPPKQRSELSCDALRNEVASRTIGRISLDISPSYRPDVLDDEKYKELRQKFDTEQESRDWRSIDGSLMATGRLRDLSYQDVVIETNMGGRQRIDISRLSEADLAFLSSEWGLPRECRISQVSYQPRAWTPSKVTWKASNLCHNPLYFEEVQLERYGHSCGPVQQPLISTAHFFVNIAVLPYKMGIHPPSECQYALGYYRPGNCAPYLLPPIPLSLRGALSEAAVIVGGFAIIP